jgi:hypothetical protein
MHEESAETKALVVWWSPRLPFKLGDSGSILGRTSTQGLQIIEEKDSAIPLQYIGIGKWLGNSLLGHPLTNE